MFLLFEYPRLYKFLELKKNNASFTGFLTLSQHIKNSFINKHQNGSKTLFGLSCPVSSSASNKIYVQLQEYLYIISQINPNVIHTINLYGKYIDKLYYHSEDFVIITVSVGSTIKKFKAKLGDRLFKSKLHQFLYDFKQINEFTNNDYIEIDVAAEVNPEYFNDYRDIVNNLFLEKTLKKMHDSFGVFFRENGFSKFSIEFEDDFETIQIKTLKTFEEYKQYENSLFYKEYLYTDSLDYLFLIHYNCGEEIQEKKVSFPVYDFVYKLILKIDKIII